MPQYAIYGMVHAMLAVMLGAFGAHGLEGKIPDDMLDVFETGVRYHMYHALGLILITLLAERFGAGKKWMYAGRLIHIGIFIFSGSLYILALSGVKVLGAITPIGGVAFIAGWLTAVVALWQYWKGQGQVK